VKKALDITKHEVQ